MKSVPFGIAVAAKRLGLSVAGVKYHVYRSKQLGCTMVGKTLVFTEQDLAEFKRKQAANKK